MRVRAGRGPGRGRAGASWRSHPKVVNPPANDVRADDTMPGRGLVEGRTRVTDRIRSIQRRTDGLAATNCREAINRTRCRVKCNAGAFGIRAAISLVNLQC